MQKTGSTRRKRPRQGKFGNSSSDSLITMFDLSGLAPTIFKYRALVFSWRFAPAWIFAVGTFGLLRFGGAIISNPLCNWGAVGMLAGVSVVLLICNVAPLPAQKR